MAFDENLADRVRTAVAHKKGIEEKKMFGGLGFLLHGNMLVAVWKDMLIARIGKEQAEKALREPHVKKMDITGKPMTGWVMVRPNGLTDDGAVNDWVQHALRFVSRLPTK
jgi:TfoX/Sxy family transcriptional regulator of competence genes